MQQYVNSELNGVDGFDSLNEPTENKCVVFVPETAKYYESNDRLKAYNTYCNLRAMGYDAKFYE